MTVNDYSRHRAVAGIYAFAILSGISCAEGSWWVAAGCAGGSAFCAVLARVIAFCERRR